MSTAIGIPGIELGAELGRGAYSVVYRARMGDADCAVKVPLVRGRWMRWVYREAVALARVRHPGLPRVIEVGEAGGVPYLAMELVDGETLAERLIRGPLSEPAAITLGIELASALTAVHAVGLTHRDVKPRNIVLSRDGRARLVDFGFAVPFDAAASDPHRVGTRGYAAPEQLAPSSRIDGRADLYSLGRVLEECLAPRSLRIVPEPSTQPKDAHSAGRRFDAVLAGLLASDPDDRYPDAPALARELEVLAGGGSALGPARYTRERRVPWLVGRSAELARANRCWQSSASSTGAVCVVSGSPGSGKSRLLEASATMARAGSRHRVLEVACRQGDPPLATLQRAFAAFVASFEEAGPGRHPAVDDVIRAAIDERLTPFARLIAPRQIPAKGSGRAALDAAPGGFAEGAAEVILGLARAAGPVFIVLDDVQWIDPVSRETLINLARRAHEAPIGLVLGGREATAEFAVIERPLAADGRRATFIELGRFTDGEVGQLIALHLGTTVVGAAITRSIAALAGGTPLGVLAVLGAMLDSGALRPHVEGWRFDAERAANVVLPPGALAPVGHRLADLPAATRRVLEAAAVVGTTFEDSLLARIFDLPLDDVGFALADARQAGILVADERTRHRFVHDTLREGVVASLDAASRRRLHQRIAEILDDGSDSGFEVRCRTALHYAAGEPQKAPAAAFRAAREASDAALERFDNETALRFLALAREAAKVADSPLDSSFHRAEGEASLRLGLLDESLVAFEHALAAESQADARAAILGRIAWVHQARAEPEEAWSVLEQAFDALGARMPVESLASATSTARHFARATIRRQVLPEAREGDRARIELLGSLHYQNARLGLEYAKPLRLVQSAVEAVNLGERLGPSRALSRALALHGFLLAVLGLGEAGAREVVRAQGMAETLGDGLTRAYCVQIKAVAECYAGRLDSALGLLRECLDVHGPWLELHEYCHHAASGEHIESMRGRASAALAWSARATDRLARSPRKQVGALEYFARRASAALASVGGDPRTDPWLPAQTLEAQRAAPAPQSLHHLLSWGPCARLLLETESLGEDFEALTRAFESERHNPRTTHPLVAEYYIAVAHARALQCIRERSQLRRARLVALRRALRDLRAAARIPLYRAHALFIEATVEWLEGSMRAARRLLGEAEVLAEAESCPWVLSEVARVRAHILRDEGKVGAAQDQARFAELLAREHGAGPRAGRVRQEFGLPTPIASTQRASSASSIQSSQNARRQLATLLQAVQKSFRALGPEEQAGAILEDLLVDLGADRGYISFQPDAEAPGPLRVSRCSDGATPGPPDAWCETLMQRVCETGDPWPPDGEDANEATRGSRMAFPLSLHTRVVGAVCLERGPTRAPFTEGDRELLLLLSHQVPVALEITRLLSEREQLQASLALGQKLEATGRLAGGMAHDFNNMLVVIRAALEHIEAQPALDGELKEELAVISGAAERASELTRQLLSFSRHQPAPRTLWQVNDLVTGLLPMLESLAGSLTKVELDLDPGLRPVRVDRTLFDQAVVNLAFNACDAMPGGGRLRIETSMVALGEAARHGAPAAGEYACLQVSDTGRGMSPDLLARIFDPFFTTKPLGQGTGLGLSIVYAFAKNSGGFVEASSEVGRGTVLRLYFPAAKVVEAVPAAPEPTPPISPPRPSTAGKTILVVDDDPYIRRMMERALRRGKHAVLLASNGADAVKLAEEHRSEIGVVILDVLMPGMTGPETARRIAQECGRARQLFMSGFAPEQLPADADRGIEFLQKPFSTAELLARVQRLLDTV